MAATFHHNRAHLLVFQPAPDALRMIEVAAWETGHLIVLLELHAADCASACIPQPSRTSSTFLGIKLHELHSLSCEISALCGHSAHKENRTLGSQLLTGPLTVRSAIPLLSGD